MLGRKIVAIFLPRIFLLITPYYDDQSSPGGGALNFFLPPNNSKGTKKRRSGTWNERFFVTGFDGSIYGLFLLPLSSTEKPEQPIVFCNF